MDEALNINKALIGNGFCFRVQKLNYHFKSHANPDANWSVFFVNL